MAVSKYFRVNERIQAKTLRVINQAGEMLGILTLEEALNKAKEVNLDLVEIAPNADPVVARITNFQKFKYDQSKKEQIAKRNAKDVSVKEIWLSPRIAQHDLLTRIKRVIEFLADSNKVKLTVKFKGREMAHPELGYQVLEQAMDLLENKAIIDREAKFEGRNLILILAPNKGARVENPVELVNNNNNNNN